MTTLVTGATGNVGRHVVDQLLRAGRRVRALTRNPKAATLPDGVEVVTGDLSAPHTLLSAFDGVTAMHLITFDGNGGAALQTGPEIVKLATSAGVQRVTVLWSGEEGPVEQAVEESELEWTLLRPTVDYMSNMLAWADSIRADGLVQEPFGNRLDAPIDEADIGAVAATALLGDGHAGRRYTLTGPEVLTIPDKVRAIGAAIGRDIQFVELSEIQARERMRESGTAEDVIEFVLGWYANPPEAASTVLPTVEELTGRPARTIAHWVAEHAAIFR
ncbi:MAG: NmrA family NAD(P)-binding protein [Pseudonocardiaceae bacterium]